MKAIDVSGVIIFSRNWLSRIPFAKIPSPFLYFLRFASRCSKRWFAMQNNRWRAASFQQVFTTIKRMRRWNTKFRSNSTPSTRAPDNIVEKYSQWMCRKSTYIYGRSTRFCYLSKVSVILSLGARTRTDILSQWIVQYNFVLYVRMIRFFLQILTHALHRSLK